MKSTNSSNPAAIRSINQIIQALFDLMKDIPYQEITIKEIAFNANVVRRTFYRHFASKEDVIDKHLDDLFANYIRKLLILEKPDTYSLAKVFFETALQHKETLLLLRKNHLSIPVNQLEIYHRELNKTLSIRRDLIDLSEKYYAYATSYFAGGLLNVLNRWIDDGMNLPPEELGELFVSLFPKAEANL